MGHISDLNKKFLQDPETVTNNTREKLLRIDEVEDVQNAFVSVTGKEAVEAAQLSKSRFLEDKPLSPLDGITVGVKDVFCTKGIRTTASSKMLENFVPVYDATVVSKLKNAGVVVVGKNNCDAWAHGASTENSDFGVTPNPYDTERVSGGSSGGSTAAVAAGECDFSIGSDTGGSIRQPASFCGVVGLKPTYGRVSRYGLIAMSSSLDCVGPIARTVGDVANIMEIIAGHDEKDLTTVDVPVPKYSELIDKPLRGKKVGLAREFFDDSLDAEIKEAVLAARDQLVALGAEVVDVNLPNLKYGVPVYYLIQPAEVSSNLGRYDGIRYGYSSDEAVSLVDHYFKSRDEGFGVEAKRRIMLGTFVLSAGYYDAYYNKAMKVRTLIRQDFDRAFAKVDVMLSPVSPTTAFKIGEKSANPLEMYLADIYTAVVNLSGNPALSLPCGFDSKGLPIGMQLIGRHLEEEVILNFGHMYEKITERADWRKKKVVI